MKTMEQEKPKTWEMAAYKALIRTSHAAVHPAYNNFSKSDECHKAIRDEFEAIVLHLFIEKQTDDSVIRKNFSKIAVAALRGYSNEKQIPTPQGMEDVLSTIIGKQRMYGHGNIARFGTPGIAIRLNDKLERLKNLQNHDGPVLFEPIADTWLDICGYAVIAMMWIDGLFLLDLQGNR